MALLYLVEFKLAYIPSSCDHCSMTALESIVDAVAIPAAPAGWFDYQYTALSDGRLILVRTRKDIHAEHARRLAAADAGDHAGKYADVWDDDLRVSIFDGVGETDVVTMPSGVSPIVDRMADGRWLVAAVHAPRNEMNGRIYAADGRKEQEINLGDGIETLLCSPDGTIWVGYFDEGIFKTANKDGSWPVSVGGIVQFDTMGTPIWSFNGQVRDGYSIANCDAMTLSGADLWTCFYDGFPIAHISDGEPKFWTNSVCGAQAIAVKDDMVILGGGYNNDANCITVIKLEAKASRKLGTLRYPLGDRNRAGLLQGRGDKLHVVSNGLWYSVAVDKAADALNECGDS